MAEKKEEKKEEAAAEAPKKKGGKKLIIIIVAVVVLLGAGVGFFLMSGSKKAEGEAEEHAQEEEVKHYETVELEPIIVNLSENASFLKIKMSLEYDPALISGAEGGEGGGGGHGGGGAAEGEKKGGLPGILGHREPQIRDAIIRVMSAKKAEEVLTVAGKDQLRQELIDAINEATGLDEGPIVNIYFIEFIIQ